MLKIVLLFAFFFGIINCDTCTSSATNGAVVVTLSYVNNASSYYHFTLLFNNTNAIMNDVSATTGDVHAFPLENVDWFSPATHVDVGNVNGGAYYSASLTIPINSATSNALKNGDCITWGFYFYSHKTGSPIFFSADLLFNLVAPVALNKRDVEEEEVVHSIASRVVCSSDVTLNTGSGFTGTVGSPYWNSASIVVGSLSGGVTLANLTCIETTGAITTSYNTANTWASIPANMARTTSVSFDCQADFTYTINVTAMWKCGGAYYSATKTQPLTCGTGGKRSSLVTEAVVVQDVTPKPVPKTVRADVAVGIASAGLAVGAVAVIAAVVIVRRRKTEQMI